MVSYLVNISFSNDTYINKIMCSFWHTFAASSISLTTFFDPHLREGLMNSVSSVCPSVTYIQYLKFFLKFGRTIEGNTTIRVGEPDFSGKIWFVQKWGKSAPNTPKMDPFALYSKLWHYFFQQMPLNDKAWYSLTLGENRTSRKNLVLEMWGKTGVLPNMWYQTYASLF